MFDNDLKEVKEWALLVSKDIPGSGNKWSAGSRSRCHLWGATESCTRFRDRKTKLRCYIRGGSLVGGCLWGRTESDTTQVSSSSSSSSSNRVPGHLRPGLPMQHSGTESTCQCRKPKRHGFNPWVKKIPYSNILAGERAWTEEAGGLQSVRPQRLRHDWATNTHT